MNANLSARQNYACPSIFQFPMTVHSWRLLFYPGFTAVSRNLSNWITEMFPVSKLNFSLSSPSPPTNPAHEAYAFHNNICECCTWRRHYMDIFKITCIEVKKFTVANRRGNKPFSNLQWAILKILTHLGKGKESCLKFIINFINRCVLNFILNKKIF